VERLARIVAESWGTKEMDARLERYGLEALGEADVTASYVGACHEAMKSMDVFAPLSMFYFAAASFAEMARRLDSPATPRRFLASDDERFVRGMGAAVRRVRAGSAFEDPKRFERTVSCAIDHRNIAGLCDSGKANWYGVDFEDVVRGAGKLGLADDRIRAWIAANGAA